LKIIEPVDAALSSWSVKVASPVAFPETVVAEAREIRVRLLLPPVIEPILIPAPFALPPLLLLSIVLAALNVTAPKSIC
jgi:hypothetical protein